MSRHHKRKKGKRKKEMHYDGGTTIISSCTHKGDKSIMQINGCNIFASSSFWGDEDGAEFGLVLNCANTGLPAMIVPPRMRHLMKFADHGGEVIRLPWRDYGKPPVKFGFWSALIEELKNFPDMLVMCQGGHGRTGTALAAMWIAANPKCTAPDAIALVRKIHCAEAIETVGQIDYLCQLAMNFGAEPYEGSMVALLPPKKWTTGKTFPDNFGCRDCYTPLYGNGRCAEHAPVENTTVTTDDNKKDIQQQECEFCFTPPDYDICKFHEVANDCAACLKLPIGVFCGAHTATADEIANVNSGVECG